MAVNESTIKEYYVYVLRDPLKKYEWFYIGKGQGNRCMTHLTETKKEIL